MNQRNAIALGILSEAAIFAMFYLIHVSVIIYYVYLGATPVLFILMSYYIEGIRKTLQKNLLHKDSIVFFSAITIWLFVFAATRNHPLYVFETAYYPVFLEEFNFRFVLIQLLRYRFTTGQSIVFQAILYAVFYGSFLLFLSQGYPGIFAELFIIDNFSMAILYGVIYYFRKNFYLPMTLHLSLYLIGEFLPASLGWIPYVTTPV